MTRLRLAIVTALGISVLPGVGAGAQVRDPGAAPQTGAGVITGTVTTEEATPQPVRRATVSVSGGGLRSQRQTITDSAGRYAVTDLPPGTFSVSTSKPSFVSINYGARLPGQPGSPITLAAGQRATANLTLMRGGVLSGMILDQFGRPRPNIRVVAMQYRVSGGQRRLQTAGSSTTGGTDDRGVYRIFGLPPGAYLIGATPNGSAPVRMVTADEVRFVQQDAPASVSGAVSPAPPLPGPTMSLAPMFYPGVADPATATTITIGPAEERAGLDFQAQPVPSAKLEGTITDHEGRPPPQPQVNLVAEDRPQSQFSSLSAPSDYGQVDQSTGKFTFQGVTPGHYTLVARSTIRFPAPPPAPPGPGQDPRVNLPIVAPPPPTVLWAMTPIDVNGHDLSGINLSLQPGLSLSGHVAFDASTTAPPADLARVRVSLSAMESGPFSVSVPSAAARPDGTFTLQGALPGRYRVSASAPFVPGPNGAPGVSWVAKSIVTGGRDVLDTGLDLEADSVSDVVVTFTDRLPELSGALLDASGAPTHNVSVMLFTTDRTFWMPQSRRIRTTMPDKDGKFRFSALPAGEYYLVAVTEADQIDLTDIPGLQQIAAASIRITLAEGEKKVQDLKVAK